MNWRTEVRFTSSPNLFSKIRLTAATGGRFCSAAAIKLGSSLFRVSRTAAPIARPVDPRMARVIDLEGTAIPDLHFDYQVTQKQGKSQAIC
jgi:hypothetical protein